MRITVLAWGTRGDIQPCIALGLGLQQAGHDVRLAAPLLFQALVTRYGLPFAPLPGDPRRMLADEEHRTSLETRNPIRAMRHVTSVFSALIEPMLRDALAACADADAIIYSPFVWAGAHIAEYLRLPCFLTLLCPLYPTRAFPNPMMTAAPSLGSLLNRLTHRMSFEFTWAPYQRQINALRRTVLDLPPLRFAGSFHGSRRWPVVHLMGYSPAVAPPPPDWPGHVHVTGSWFLPAPLDWTPPPELRAFLAAGPPPVYIGFGSMRSQDSAAETRLVLEALARTGQRGILLKGWGGLRPLDLPPDALMIDAVPHEWLFPRMAAVVHHGGGGTCAAGLAAGVPSVIVPFLAEQPYWGRRLWELGVSPEPIPHRRLTLDRLAQAISAATGDHTLRQRAARLGQQLRGEDGVQRAVDLVQRYAGVGAPVSL